LPDFHFATVIYVHLFGPYVYPNRPTTMLENRQRKTSWAQTAM